MNDTSDIGLAAVRKKVLKRMTEQVGRDAIAAIEDCRRGD